MVDDTFGTVLHRNIDAAKAALFNKMEEMKLKNAW